MLFLLGFALGLDSFRVSASLGTLGLSSARQSQIALAFGLCDAFAPLVGLAVGQSLVNNIGRWTEYLGPLLLGGYGLYVIYLARHCEETERDVGYRWVLFGLPLVLSLDNLVAGVGLGMIGFPILLSVLVIGTISGLMSMVGLKLGNAMMNYVPIGPDLLGGVALVFVAVTLVLDLG